MAQHTLASATSLLKTALRQKYGLSVMVQAASLQALRKGQLVWDDLLPRLAVLSERGASEGTKSKPAPNQNPHESLALTSYAEWDKVLRFTHVIPNAGGVDVYGRYHCRQICNTRCKKRAIPPLRALANRRQCRTSYP
jgi:hypothetical protein